MKVAARRQKALEYALEGKTVREIGALLGVSHTTAWKDILAAHKAFAKTNAQAIEEHREYMATRYERQFELCQVSGPPDPNSKAFSNQLAILDRLCQLYGLDRPVKRDDDKAVTWPTTIVFNHKYFTRYPDGREVEQTDETQSGQEDGAE